MGLTIIHGRGLLDSQDLQTLGDVLGVGNIGDSRASAWNRLNAAFAVTSNLLHSESARRTTDHAISESFWSLASTPDLNPPTTISADDLQVAFHKWNAPLPLASTERQSPDSSSTDLSPLDLGAIYEWLLGHRAQLDPEKPYEFDLQSASAGRRRETGAYYTPEHYVEAILRATIDPLLDEAEKTADPRSAMFRLRVCDPACGSGRFLVHAARRIAARIQSSTAESCRSDPSFDSMPGGDPTALGEVIEKCIYGVDIDAIAVDLCRLSLWVESGHRGSLPDGVVSHIRCGNSLLGATPDAITRGIPDVAFDPLEADSPALCRSLRRRNRAERSKEALAAVVAGAPGGGDKGGNDARPGLIANVFCGVLMSPKTAAGCDGELHLTDADLQALRRDESKRLSKPQQRSLEKLRAQHRFFHWHIEFPEVLGSSASISRTASAASEGECESESVNESAGFDAVIGNPPFVDSESLKREAPRFRHIIPALYETARGNWDLFIPFVELCAQLTRRGGYHGLVTPMKLFGSAYSTAVQNLLLHQRHLVLCQDFSRGSQFSDSGIPIAVHIARNITPRPDATTTFVRDRSETAIEPEVRIAIRSLAELPSGFIGAPFRLSDPRDLRLLASRPALADVADVSDGATTAEAYALRQCVTDLNDHTKEQQRGDDQLRLVNTGTIAAFGHLWGRKPITYLGFKAMRPVVCARHLQAISERRLLQTLRQKVVVAGLCREVRAAACGTGVLCGKSAVLILPHPRICPHALAVVLNSRRFRQLYCAVFGVRGPSRDTMHVGPRQLERMPVPAADQLAPQPPDGRDKPPDDLHAEPDRAIKRAHRMTRLLQSGTKDDVSLSAIGLLLHLMQHMDLGKTEAFAALVDAANLAVDRALRRDR